MEQLKQVAREALDAFEAIDDAASQLLRQRGLSLQSLAVVNEATAEAVAGQMRERNLARSSNLQELRRKPAIARLIIADEHDVQETIYVAPNAEVTVPGLKLCSFLNNAGKGRLASCSPGGGDYVALSEGRRYFEVLDKVTFEPRCDGDGWDARPAIVLSADAVRTIKSLRALLREAGVPDEEIDAMERWASAGQDDGNVVPGIVHEARTAMELRLAPILDKFQGDIFRQPINSRIAVMGPPGTGKTTTMVVRLRQKLDLAYLDEEELRLVEQPDPAGLDHPDSWVLFTPTELLRLYVKEALGRKGVPVHDQRLRTWDDYRRDIARNTLRILRTGAGAGLTIREEDGLLGAETLTDQIAWFEAFDAFQKELFARQIAAEVDRLTQADARAALLGRRVAEAIARGEGNVLQLLSEIAGQAESLREFSNSLSEAIRRDLAAPGNRFVRSDPGFMDALVRLVAELQQAGDDAVDEDDEDADEDEEATPALEGRKLAVDVFRKAMRTMAMSQAVGRKPGEKSRAARVMTLLDERGLQMPNLATTGHTLVIQRAARRLARAPAAYLGSMPLRYRRFRRVQRATGQWYGDAVTDAGAAHPAEIDLVILAMFRAASAFEGNRLLSTRLANDRRPPPLDAIATLRRNQVLVDEMTDFSPLQLAAMAELSAPKTQAVFLSGDFNQRLTRQGIRTERELQWAVPGLEIRPISVSYRQSRMLAHYARTLAQTKGSQIDDRPPDYGQNIGFDPVYGLSLDSDAKRAEWLALRIREVEKIADGQLPTIAVLVADSMAVGALESDPSRLKRNLRW